MTVNDLATQASAVGWLIDRTAGESGCILGSAWLFSRDTAVTCAHLMVPYADILEAISIYLPAFQRTFGIADTKFHPDFDRWMVRRSYEESAIYPPPRLSLTPSNVVGLRLSSRLQPVQKEMVDKKLQMFAAMQESAAFSGTSSGAELMSIIQTIVQARQVGTIIICDSLRRILARIYCESGAILHVQYGELKNEVAIYQLIVAPPDGRFFFKVENKPVWTQNVPPITRPTPNLLMEVFRRLDEQNRILEEFGGELTTFIRVPNAHLNLQVLPPEVHKDATLLWPKLKYETPIGRFIHNRKVDGAAVMRALEALARTEQVISATAVPLNYDGKPVALSLEPYSPASNKDELYSIYVDPASQMSVVSTGTILGSRKPDPATQMHTISIPPQVLGAPILKEGRVIGMHCGNIAGIEEDNQFQEVNQLVWSESIYTCLGLKLPEAPAWLMPQLDTASGADKPASVPPPRAETISSETAAVPAKRPIRNSLLTSIPFPFKRKAAIDYEVELQRQEFGSDRWSKISVNTRIRSGDILSISLKVLQEEISLCVLYSRSDSVPARLLFPDAGNTQCDLLPKGTQLVLPAPAQDLTRPGGKARVTGIRMNQITGQENLIFIHGFQPFTVPVDQGALDVLLDNALVLAQSQPDLTPVEVSEQQLFGHGDATGENVFSISRLSLNCR
jgi:hypothetical protein